VQDAKAPAPAFPTEFSAEVVTISPALAEQMLVQPSPYFDDVWQHVVDEHLLNWLASDMADDCYLNMSAAIVFDKEGNLVDGRHRLRACVQARVPFRTVVVFGVDVHDHFQVHHRHNHWQARPKKTKRASKKTERDVAIPSGNAPDGSKLH
jgi:hypothetical protein